MHSDTYKKYQHNKDTKDTKDTYKKYQYKKYPYKEIIAVLILHGRWLFNNKAVGLAGGVFTIATLYGKRNRRASFADFIGVGK